MPPPEKSILISGLPYSIHGKRKKDNMIRVITGGDMDVPEKRYYLRNR